MFILGPPCWLSGKESACQCKRHGFHPWSGRFPHAVEQLSLPQLLSPCASRACDLQPEKPPQWETQRQSRPRLPQLEKVSRQQQRPGTAKNKINKKFKSCLFHTKCDDRKKYCQCVHHSFHADLFFFCIRKWWWLRQGSQNQ